MLRIINLNVNGLRSATQKGLFNWLVKQAADVICLQEIRMDSEHFSNTLYQLPNYHCYYATAEKKGYSGVAIYTRHLPLNIQTQLKWLPSDGEGRYVRVDYDNLSIVCVYMPSGSSGEARQAIKFQFLDYYREYLKALRKEAKDYILCGDWNMAHTQKDIKNWRGNQKNSGFLPEERAWLDEVFGPMGYVDAFRVMNEEEDQYTWWSNRGQARAKNVGWRIDYQIVTPNLKDKIKNVDIYKGERFSDHAPLLIDYDLSITN